MVRCACAGTSKQSPLAEYAKGLTEAEPQPPRMCFPMYTVPLKVLLQMGEMIPHEELKATGRLVEFQNSLGKAMFVSHQWVGHRHPDPEFKQLKVLQDALTYVTTELEVIPVDLVTETMMPSAKGLRTAELRSDPLFIWYDYFCCPQLEYTSQRRDNENRSQLLNAIASIPAYVNASSFFFALCPVVENPSQSMLFTPASWAERGWCRVERALRELCSDESWIMAGVSPKKFPLFLLEEVRDFNADPKVKSASNVELVLGKEASVGGGPPGEGEFSVAEDRTALAPVMVDALRRKLHMLLQSQDLVSYRLVLNLQGVYLSGLPAETLHEPVPGFSMNTETDSVSMAVASFLFQNGFASVRQRDRAGWSPLHYASLRGDPTLIQGLLDQRADPNCKTRRDQPRVGIPPLTSAVSICLLYKHNKAARLLIEAGAAVNGSGQIRPPMTCAADANNAEGVRLLCESGCSPHARNLFGISAFESACACGSMAAMEELLSQSQSGFGGRSFDMSDALFCAMLHRGGTAELVQWLVSKGANVNKSRSVWKHSVAFGILTTLKSLQHTYGTASACTKSLHHVPEATPLMLAVNTSQYAGAAALVAAGARLDIRNLRGWSAADFAKGQSMPGFLMQALEGNPTECLRVSAIASDGYVEVFF